MFIVTTNEETAKKLEQAGFPLVSGYPDRWTFLYANAKYDKEKYPDSKLTNVVPM